MAEQQGLVQLEVLGVAGDSFACLSLEPSANGALIKSGLASQQLVDGCGCVETMALITQDGQIFKDADTIATLGPCPVLQVSFGDVVPVLFDRTGGATVLSEDKRSLKWTNNSGGSTAGPKMFKDSGTYTIRVCFEDIGESASAENKYVSLGLVLSTASLACGPGYVSGDVAWSFREGKASVKTAGADVSEDKIKVSGTVPVINSGDKLQMRFDTGSCVLDCLNETTNQSCQISDIPFVWKHMPLQFGIGGASCASASLLG